MLVIYALCALDLLSMSLFMPIFHRSVVYYGGSHQLTGLLVTSNAIISLIWRPVAGNLSDTKGPKNVMVWCLLIYLVGNILSYLSTTVYVFCFARLLCASGTPLQTLLRMTATEISGGDKSIFSKLGIVFAFSFMAGAVIGGFLSEHGFYLIYLLITINLLVSLVLTRFLPDVKAKDEKKGQSPKSTLSEKFYSVCNGIKSLEWSRYWEVFTAKALIEFTYVIMQMNLALVLLQFGIQGRYMGYVFLTFGVTGLVVNVLSMKIKNLYYSKDNGYLRVLHACSLLAISYIGLGLSPVIASFIFFLITMCVARTLLDTTMYELLDNKVGTEGKSTITSLFDNMLSISEIVGPIIGTTLATLYGQQNAILLCAVPTAVATAVINFKKSDVKVSQD